jgi:hypothetical protein
MTGAIKWIPVVLIVVSSTVISIYASRQYQIAKAELEENRVTSGKLARDLQTLQKQLAAQNRIEEIVSTNTSRPDDQLTAINDLQAQLADKNALIASLQRNNISNVVPDVMRNSEPEERRNWLENLQTSDPERYKEIMEQRETARQAAKYDIAKKAAHFLIRDDVEMSEQEAEQYTRMMTLLEDSMKLTEQLNADLPQDQRREIGRDLRHNMRELSPLLESERDKELYRIGKDLGYTDEDAAGFALYIRDVIDVTSVNSIFRNSMRAMGTGGGWGDQGRPTQP